MNKRLFFIPLFFLLAAQQPVQAEEQDPPPPAEGQEQQKPDITSVSVDGTQYSTMEYIQYFGDQPLHWVADAEAEAQGMLVAYTTEENVDAALGVQPLGEDEAIDAKAASSPAASSPLLYDGIFFTGRSWRVQRNIGHLGEFNDLISSVNTRGATIRLYEHKNYNRHQAGCSLTITGKDRTLLNDFCRPFQTWNDRASSVKILRG
jgi:hypothetical protein